MAVASLGLWSLIEHEQLSLIGYLARVSTFFLVGALAGYLAEYLRQARDAQQLLFDLAPESALAIDLDGNVTIANAAAQSLFGYGAHELAGQPVDQLVPDFFAVLRLSFREVRNPGDALRFTACFKDGRATRVRGTVEALASDRCALLIRLQTTEASPEGA